MFRNTHYRCSFHRADREEEMYSFNWLCSSESYLFRSVPWNSWSNCFSPYPPPPNKNTTSDLQLGPGEREQEHKRTVITNIYSHCSLNIGLNSAFLCLSILTDSEDDEMIGQKHSMEAFHLFILYPLGLSIQLCILCITCLIGPICGNK